MTRDLVSSPQKKDLRVFLSISLLLTETFPGGQRSEMLSFTMSRLTKRKKPRLLMPVLKVWLPLVKNHIHHDRKNNSENVAPEVAGNS